MDDIEGIGDTLHVYWKTSETFQQNTLDKRKQSKALAGFPQQEKHGWYTFFYRSIQIKHQEVRKVLLIIKLVGNCLFSMLLKKMDV